MRLTRYLTERGPRWAVDSAMLPEGVGLRSLLGMRTAEMDRVLNAMPRKAVEDPTSLAPIDAYHEIWAAGVTYLRSRDERQAESSVADVYGRVYEAARPELFFKSLGWRSVGSNSRIRIRKDSSWNVPEPELTLVVNRYGEIVGYTAGNDVSSRSIEGENPLYLPQAKSYDGSCAIGPSIVLTAVEGLSDLPIECNIRRGGVGVFSGQARTSQMKRQLSELVDYLFRETSFPEGVFLMTGTGIVPAHPFTLECGDEVTVKVGELSLINEVDGHF